MGAFLDKENGVAAASGVKGGGGVASRTARSLAALGGFFRNTRCHEEHRSALKVSTKFAAWALALGIWECHLHAGDQRHGDQLVTESEH